MEGPDAHNLFDTKTSKPFELSGILPRIAVFIQKEIERYQRQFGQQIFIEVSALEIYCENVRDLLWMPSAKVDKHKQRYVDIKNNGNKVQCLG